MLYLLPRADVLLRINSMQGPNLNALFRSTLESLYFSWFKRGIEVCSVSDFQNNICDDCHSAETEEEAELGP